MLKRYAAITVLSCLLAAPLTVSSSATARAAECLSGPNAQSGPGTHWRYRINHATGQHCWYLKRVGEAARPRPTSESPANSRTPRSGGSEPAPTEAATEVTSSIKAWFSSTFSSFSFGRSATNTETNEASANDTTSKPGSERTEQRKSQQSKSEQQAKASPSEPEKKRSDTARAPSAALQAQILEAAGDKFLPGTAPEQSEDEKRTAIEAVGEKDVFALQTMLEDWQKELYEQFLEWRITQLMLHTSDEKISRSHATSD